MTIILSMNNITVCYSTHRPETLELTARIMEDHDIIILEEPYHADFASVLSGGIKIQDHLLELDFGYPEFSLGQYQLLQQFARVGKQILQIEPYLDHLLDLQFFLADDHGPDEIEPGTVAYSVYCRERDATGLLIQYYREVQGGDFINILSAMNAFAKADAARFVLRDSLRAQRILEVLVTGEKTYIEAGSIHYLLYRLLAKNLSGLPEKWQLHMHSVDREAIQILNHRGSIFSPGDHLTLSYIFGRKLSRQKWALECAQALIFSKIIQKEEIWSSGLEFPHTRNEIESIAAVKNLSLETCRILFQRIRNLSSEEAAEVVKKESSMSLTIKKSAGWQ
ncbi:MAG: hypothetical protein WBB19_19545 [Desulforhopalus sp.]